ncbi:hypothetical protein D9Q98_008238 [Chlorella vulgaris]|uniref:Uncharacterized protein n=1 Tax=Chlorella vulgaris TaxID=3077 RepID=A0A9D4YT78_CHLVU|nr:hypothetical protein D9Q98_008238 [Chlorella vulgaris]
MQLATITTTTTACAPHHAETFAFPLAKARCFSPEALEWRERLRVSEAAGRKKPSGVNLPVIHSAAFQCTNQHTHSDACFVGVAAHLTASRA